MPEPPNNVIELSAHRKIDRAKVWSLIQLIEALRKAYERERDNGRPEKPAP